MLREKVGIPRVFIRAGYTDLRMGIDGLACLIQNYFDLNPFDGGTLFLFCGRSSNRIKGLLWEGLSADFCYPHNCPVYVEKWASIRNKCADKHT